ncbi:MAG: polysaccharide biosynthesis tyrosine autokinase, partial [Oceanidesulfovibrio sp.]
HSLETRLSTVQDAITWLNKRIASERVKVETAEAKFQEFKDEHAIISDFSENIEEVKARQLSDLRARIVDAETEMIEARTRYQQTSSLMEQGQPLDSIPAVLENQLILSIKQKEVELRNRMSELSRTYGPNHPQIRAVNAELGTLEMRMRTEAMKIMESLQNQFELSKARYDSLVKSLEKQERQVLELNKLAAEYKTLQSDAVGAREIFNMLVQRFKEASVSEDMPTVNIHVVDAAQLPSNPVRPKTFLYLAAAAFFGLLLGLGLVFFLEYLDNTLKTPEDVKRWLATPFLGVIPYQKGVASDTPGSLISVNDPKSLPSEAYRSLRTSVLFSLADQEPKTLQVTSAGPGEGKTLTAINLAVTMAQNGSRTIIVDCDMRRPMVHKTLGLNRLRGVSNILANPKEEIDSLVQESGIPNLYVMPAGPIPPNPSELIGGKRMQDLLDYLKPRFDKIIVDTPPVTAVTDSTLIANKVEGVVMVVRAFATSRDVVRTGLDALRKINAKILGVVLNGVKLEKEGYYYYQYYYYYYASDDTGRRSRRKKTREGAPAA